MKKAFLDVGRFNGVAIEQYCVDDSWDIFSWDPNPQPGLDHLPAHILYESAVWTENGEVTFSLDPHVQASHITGIAGTDYEETKIVPAIDFSEFVRNLPPYDLIICSFDAEGVEFAVLRKMIADGTIYRINMLDVEFHHRMMLNEDDKSARQLTQQLWDLGVIVRQKVPLNR